MDSKIPHSDPCKPSADAGGADVVERRLLDRVVARDREAMRELYLTYHRRLARFLVRITRNHALIEEIVNDTMLTVWRHAADFRGGSRVSTWIFGIAWRTGLKGLRREQRAVVTLLAPELATGFVEDPLADREALQNAMQTLSPEHCAVIELAYVGGYSCQEIGVIMQCPPNTVKTRLYHARLKLRTALTVAGHAVPIGRKDHRPLTLSGFGPGPVQAPVAAVQHRA